MLCLFLKTLDRFTDLRGIVPGSLSALRSLLASGAEHQVSGLPDAGRVLGVQAGGSGAVDRMLLVVVVEAWKGRKQKSIGADLKVGTCPAGSVFLASYSSAPSGINATGCETSHFGDTRGDDVNRDVRDVGQDFRVPFPSNAEASSAVGNELTTA